jgi:hypothetical protein
VYHVVFDALLAQPARQPEAVAAGLESNGNALNGTASFGGFFAPALQQ